MGLLPTTQLQPVLDLAQERIGEGQLVKVFAADVSLIVQLLEGEERASRPQPGLFAAVHALQTLDQELDVAYAAGIHLNVSGRYLGHSPRPALGHFAACGDGRLDGGKIQLLLVHKRLDSADEGPRQGQVSGGVTRLDERLHLPVMRYGSVVMQGMAKADGRFAFKARHSAGDLSLARA